MTKLILIETNSDGNMVLSKYEGNVFKEQSTLEMDSDVDMEYIKSTIEEYRKS